MDSKLSPLDQNPPAYNQTGQNPFTPQPMPQPGFQPIPQPIVQPQVQPIVQPSTSENSRFDQLVRQHELNPTVANQLKTVLTSCVVVLLCDDSDSMNRPIAEEGTDPFAPKRSTRWLELKKLASNLIEVTTAVSQTGLDIHFLNRPTLRNVSSTVGLQGAFSVAPNGGTPLIGKIRSIFQEYSNVPKNQNLLLIVLTDGEPSDGSRNDLFNVLNNKNANIHLSFAELTDMEDDMEYLDQWDGVIKNFDNTDDYREELQRVKMTQGAQFKFDYMDYVVKILLATFVRWYFNIDQVRVNSQPNNYVQAVYQPQVQQTSYPQQQYQQPVQYTQQSVVFKSNPNSCCTLL